MSVWNLHSILRNFNKHQVKRFNFNHDLCLHLKISTFRWHKLPYYSVWCLNLQLSYLVTLVVGSKYPALCWCHFTVILDTVRESGGGKSNKRRQNRPGKSRTNILYKLLRGNIYNTFSWNIQKTNYTKYLAKNWILKIAITSPLPTPSEMFIFVTNIHLSHILASSK